MIDIQKLNISFLKLKEFSKELEKLEKEERSRLGRDELNHIIRIDWFVRILFWLGVAGSIWFINPISAFIISLAKTTKWTILAHHISHGGYDKIEGVPKRFQSKHFAQGKRRLFDWHDWLYPHAWDLEHNILHHYHTSEFEDPDFVQRNTSSLRNSNLPVWIKYTIAFFLASHWKISYYAPNIYWFYYQKNNTNENLKQALQKENNESFPGSKIYSPFNAIGLNFWKDSLLPYFFSNFILLPMIVLPLGIHASLFLLANLILAEIFTNLHSFLIIVTNHSGDDMPYFNDKIKSKSEFNFRQIIASVNFTGGKNWSDFLQGYLNYQIEHHLWPDLPALSYRRIQPKLEALCHEYNIPYKKENVFKRAIKLFNIMVGKRSMFVMSTK